MIAGGVTAGLFPVYFLQPSIKKKNKVKNLACLPFTVATAHIPAWKRSLFKNSLELIGKHFFFKFFHKKFFFLFLRQ